MAAAGATKISRYSPVVPIFPRQVGDDDDGCHLESSSLSSSSSSALALGGWQHMAVRSFRWRTRRRRRRRRRRAEGATTRPMPMPSPQQPRRGAFVDARGSSSSSLLGGVCIYVPGGGSSGTGRRERETSTFPSPYNFSFPPFFVIKKVTSMPRRARPDNNMLIKTKGQQSLPLHSLLALKKLIIDLHMSIVVIRSVYGS